MVSLQLGHRKERGDEESTSTNRNVNQNAINVLFARLLCGKQLSLELSCCVLTIAFLHFLICCCRKPLLLIFPTASHSEKHLLVSIPTNLSPMRFSLLAFAAAISTSNAWTSAPPALKTRTSNRQQGILHSLATPPSAGNSNKGVDEELQLGRVLEGGAVIDFSSVKANGRAEAALAEAKRSLNPEISLQKNGEILGINEEVISEVGHPLAQFASQEDIQECAAYLRSLAPNGLLESKEDAVQYSPEKIQKFEQLLKAAYVEAGEVTSAFAKTFYLGTQLLGPAAQQAIWAVYVWCRRTDEIVDAPREDDSEMLRDLSSWELRLEDLWKTGRVEDVFDLCLLDCRVKYPTLDITPFSDMIRGMLMDVPDLGQERYDTFEELHLYCYRVAGTVGLMSLPIFGCAPGYNDDIARFVMPAICFVRRKGVNLLHTSSSLFSNTLNKPESPLCP